MKTETFKIVISPEQAGQRLDKVLAQHELIQSRSAATNLINNQFVQKANVFPKPSYITKLGEEFLVTLNFSKIEDVEPFEGPLNIVYEDADVLVINKPSGLVVHPAAGHFRDTLVNILKFHGKVLSSGSTVGRPGIVHRIDKDTSGLLVIAKNDVAHRSLAMQFKNKTTRRTYWAICFGEPHKKHDTIASVLARDPNDRKKFASLRTAVTETKKGKLAITHYNVIKKLNIGLALIHCQLETGRTHQIRVHLSEAKLPIVGDPIYGRSPRTKRMNEIQKTAPHLLLHAAELGFKHPVSKKQLTFSAPWPIEVSEFLKKIGFESET